MTVNTDSFIMHESSKFSQCPQILDTTMLQATASEADLHKEMMTLQAEVLPLTREWEVAE